MVAEGGEGENPRFVSLQVPTSEAAVSADTHAFARLPPGGLRKNRNLRGLWFLWGKGPRPLVGRAPSPGGPGPKPPGDLAHRPLGPGSRHSHSFPASQVFNFLLRLKPWVRVSKRYHNPQSADLGGRWMVSEGGAVQFHERRGSRLRSSISAAGPGLGATSQPCIPVKNSKNAPVLIGS